MNHTINVLAVSVVAVMVLWGGANSNPLEHGGRAVAMTIKICATYQGHELKCGSGVIVKNNRALTAFHVVSDVVVDPLKPAVKPSLVVLGNNSKHYKPAILVSTYPSYDIAIVEIDGEWPTESMDSGFSRDETVVAVGNPEGRDFVVVPTRITGLDLMEKPSRDGLVEMITVDSIHNKITHGFSGGGLFSGKGLVGVIQLCSDEAETCLAMPTREIEKLIEGDLK